MDDNKRRAFIRKQVAKWAKKHSEGVVPLTRETTQMKGVMDHCLAQEKWVDHLKEKAKAIQTELNELKTWKKVQVKKLTMTKKALGELKSQVDELRKML